MLGRISGFWTTTCKPKILSRRLAQSCTFRSLFFLSKTGCRVQNLRFVKTYDSKWDGVDVLITANPKALEAKPAGKVSVKVKTNYNKDVQADYEIDSLLDFMKDSSLREKILAKTITITYEEIK